MLGTPDEGIGNEVLRLDLSGITGVYFLILVLGVLAYTGVMAMLFTKTLLRSSEFPSPHALTTSLTLLTFVALTAAIATNSAALETIAATGMGAIAGALSHVFTSGAPNDRKAIPEETDQETGDALPGEPDPEE